MNERIAASISSQRDRARSLLQQQRQRVRNVENQLLETLQELAVEIATIECSADQRDAELQRRAESLCEESLRIEDKLAALRRGGVLFDAGGNLEPLPANNLSEQVGLESQLEEMRLREFELRQQLDDSQRQAERYCEALEELREEYLHEQQHGDQPSSQFANQGAEADVAQENTELKAERIVLLDRIESLETQRDDLSAQCAESAELADMQRRFELAVQELRELKTRNAELSEKLAQHPGAVPLGAGFNWEARKSRMIAELEAEGDEPGGNARNQRLSIEGTIRITDQVIAEKDREIGQLKARLEQLERQRSAASDPENFLDSNQLIRTERERLQRLQDECRDKQRQSEIDLSLERAKLARERMQLEQQLHEARATRVSANAENLREGQSKSTAPSGRWFARLGLSRDDQE